MWSCKQEMNLRCLGNTSCRLTAHPHCSLRSKHTTPTLLTTLTTIPHNASKYCLKNLWGLRFVCYGLPCFYITLGVSHSYRNIMVWRWGAGAGFITPYHHSLTCKHQTGLLVGFAIRMFDFRSFCSNCWFEFSKNFV